MATVRAAYGEGDKPPHVVGQELGVDVVLAGSLQIVDDEDVAVVRLELIDAATGEQTWGDTFRRDYDDLLEMLTQISTAAAEQLDIELTGETQELLATPETDALEAL